MKNVIGFFLIVLLISCKKDDIINLDEQYSGGETTVFAEGPSAYTFPSANLSGADLQKHLEADAAFAQTFVSAPSNNFGGLGPIFNQNSCENCHVRNGRGTLPQFDGDNNSGALLRISIPGYSANQGIIPVPGFGGQLQTKAIFGGVPEGQLSKSEITELVTFLDGHSVVLTKPSYAIQNPYTPLPAGVQTSFRVAPAVFGLGLIDAIKESDILAFEDLNDVNGDGISGKANRVYDIKKGALSVGKYGWKAGQPTAEQQSADAAHNDMGLTSSYFPTESCNSQSNCNIGLQPDYDIDDEVIELFTFYFQTLAVPATRNLEIQAFQDGKTLFNAANCSACHNASFTTSIHPIAALSNQVIYPYSDFLLHDMGDGLADYRSEYDATGTEWRTTPLWGIGLAKIVNINATFLHDGRANTIEEAILWHGGEAENAKNYYMNLSQSNREKLLYFLNSL